MRYCFCFFLLLNCFYLKSQKEANVWCFGTEAGLDFNKGAPNVLTNVKMSSTITCSSISDVKGKLLIYTDGDTVFNGRHEVMFNGIFFGSSADYLRGETYLMKMPGNDSMYFLLQTGSAYYKRLRRRLSVQSGYSGVDYRMINIKARNGRGEVLQPRVLLIDSLQTESVAAIEHANGKDLWLMFRGQTSNEYFCYLVTSSGIQPNPVISSVGPYVGENVSYGVTKYSKFSPDGKKYAICIWEQGVCLYDFDKRTGKLSNLKIIPSIHPCHPVAVEFSPNGKKCYVSYIFKGIFQYDISTGDVQDMIASEYLLQEVETPGAVQLGPDKKIYMVEKQSGYISVVNSPNRARAACLFKKDMIYLKGKVTGIALPTFISSYFGDSSMPVIKHKGQCVGDRLNFECTDLDPEDSVVWDFGDVASGIQNTSSLKKPWHVFSKVDSFLVQAFIYRIIYPGKYRKEGPYKTRIFLKDYLGPARQYPLMVSKCTSDSAVLNAAGGGGLSKIHWNDVPGSFFRRAVKNPGLYIATVYKTGSNCFYKDSILITDIPHVSKPDLGEDTMYCIPYGLLPDISLGKGLSTDFTYRWGHGDSGRVIKVKKAGQYSVVASQPGFCSNADTVELSVKEMPAYRHLPDTWLCRNRLPASIRLQGKNYDHVIWHTGDTGFMTSVFLPGRLYYTISNICGSLSDSLNVTIADTPAVDLGGDLVMCSLDGLQLQSNIQGVKYDWQPSGATTAHVLSYDTGKIVLTVKSAAGCYGRDQLSVYDTCQEYCFMPDAFTPGNDGINDLFRPGGERIRQQGYLFRIYDSWGALVFETSDTNAGWNGRVKDAYPVAGVYFYTLDFTTYKRRPVQKKGTFHLLL